MVETTWPELANREVSYGDRRWRLTGRVDLRGTGEVVVAEATRVDDVRHERAGLRFGLEDPPDSLNPGDLVDHFDSLERRDGRYTLVVKASGRTYRYALRGIDHG